MNLQNRIRRRINERSRPSLRSVCRQLSRWWYTDVTAEHMLGADWDYLFLLDACRSDTFASVSNLPGDTATIETGATMTVEWLERHVAGTQLHDTVYITGNHQIQTYGSRLEPDFHAYKMVEPDHPTGVATPEAVAAAARQAEREYPSKRLLVHFVQPHTPYLGPIGREIRNGISLSEVYARTDATMADIKFAYRENLDIVLSVVADLFEEFEGRFVVSADHGELLGERLRPVPIRDFGHPRGVYHEALLSVPWHSYERGERRTVVAEQPAESLGDGSPDELDDRLAALGYR